MVIYDPPYFIALKIKMPTSYAAETLQTLSKFRFHVRINLQVQILLSFSAVGLHTIRFYFRYLRLEQNKNTDT